MPLAAALFLLEADLRGSDNPPAHCSVRAEQYCQAMSKIPNDCASALFRLFSSARDTTVAFVLASVGTLVGTAVAWMALSQRLGAGGWQVSSKCLELDGFPSRYKRIQRLSGKLVKLRQCLAAGRCTHSLLHRRKHQFCSCISFTGNARATSCCSHGSRYITTASLHESL